MTPSAVRAKLHLLDTEEGGRSAPIESGYRSLVRFSGANVDFGSELELESDVLAPGEAGACRLMFWAVDALPALSAGQRFELREGARVVGHGEILAAT